MTKFYIIYFSCILYVVRSAKAVTPTQKAVIQAKLLSGGLECIKDHPLSSSDIQFFRQKMMPENENAKCFTACLFKKIGIMDDMGMLSASSARNSAKTVFRNNEEQLSKVDELINKCSSVNEHPVMDDKGCDRAKLVFMCLSEQAPKLNFDIDF